MLYIFHTFPIPSKKGHYKLSEIGIKDWWKSLSFHCFAAQRHREKKETAEKCSHIALLSWLMYTSAPFSAWKVSRAIAKVWN